MKKDKKRNSTKEDPKKKKEMEPQNKADKEKQKEMEDRANDSNKPIKGGLA